MNNISAIIIGALISIMIYFNGALGILTGNYLSSVIIHIVGLVTIIVVLIGTKSKLNLKRGIPLYMYSAGVIGVFTVLFNNITCAILGVSLIVALGLLGQSIASIIIDHFGLLGMKVNKFNSKKLVGFTIILVGIMVMSIY